MSSRPPNRSPVPDVDDPDWSDIDEGPIQTEVPIGSLTFSPFLESVLGASDRSERPTRRRVRFAPLEESIPRTSGTDEEPIQRRVRFAPLEESVPEASDRDEEQMQRSVTPLEHSVPGASTSSNRPPEQPPPAIRAPETPTIRSHSAPPALTPMDDLPEPSELDLEEEAPVQAQLVPAESAESPAFPSSGPLGMSFPDSVPLDMPHLDYVEVLDCPICLEGVDATWTIHVPCLHSFCLSCMCAWITQNQLHATCPLCRKPISFLAARNGSRASQILPALRSELQPTGMAYLEQHSALTEGTAHLADPEYADQLAAIRRRITQETQQRTEVTGRQLEAHVREIRAAVAAAQARRRLLEAPADRPLPAPPDRPRTRGPPRHQPLVQNNPPTRFTTSSRLPGYNPPRYRPRGQNNPTAPVASSSRTRTGYIPPRNQPAPQVAPPAQTAGPSQPRPTITESPVIEPPVFEPAAQNNPPASITASPSVPSSPAPQQSSADRIEQLEQRLRELDIRFDQQVQALRDRSRTGLGPSIESFELELQAYVARTEERRRRSTQRIAQNSTDSEAVLPPLPQERTDDEAATRRRAIFDRILTSQELPLLTPPPSEPTDEASDARRRAMFDRILSSHELIAPPPREPFDSARFTPGYLLAPRSPPPPPPPPAAQPDYNARRRAMEERMGLRQQRRLAQGPPQSAETPARTPEGTPAGTPAETPAGTPAGTSAETSAQTPTSSASRRRELPRSASRVTPTVEPTPSPRYMRPTESSRVRRNTRDGQN
ncbi:hypothetical protein EDC01DRAFT_645742 [Geopyxis carbonaria]|nr:hypothetical protein EDC01DRAFT_645742 [Geopyxis carbonaria]